MASLSPSHFLLLCLTASLFLSTPGFAYEFTVGGPLGWTVPTDGNEPESNYNHWALRTRFHVGDSLYFKYENDSVVRVSREDYRNCDSSHPIFESTDGNTTFEFDRVGFFYFISGEPGHCSAGQRMIVRVVGGPEDISPAGAPVSSPGPESSPSSGSGPSSHHHSSAAFKHGVGYGAFVVLPFMVLLFA